ncbi:flagellar biosynthesis anti-sigma factor FlgM [uncultured Pseudodesulfovibrio sp.]|uniref:flagellar biosynthesis anti-sigma factor FlgM n=1 Tax=uncultured Pseudodesulfovibrio sp. TaxID=2035858 RepID=UPI0029C8111F|nr:flagellar biosynthesis anti-sigma factor FlgM [uncultured Pseudodesulfovibrio sp.]
MVIKNIVGDQNPYANKKIERPQAKELQRTQEAVKNSGEAADRVVLSPEGRLRGAALQTANEAPDVRRKKVDELKKQVQDGSYRPDLKKAAANLIRDDLDLLV